MKKTTVKKILSCMLATVTAFSALASCASGDTSDSVNKEDDSDTVQEIRDISAAELVKEMKIGWNLGNTLDATGTGMGTETAWIGSSNKTNKHMIDLLKETGFNVLRVPVTWEGHLGAGPDFKIDEAWLNRVQEIVDYGIDNDMFVILNLHHESWHMPTNDNYEAASAELKTVWTQIAAHFQGYDEHLIFEGMNEPRLVGTPYEWTGGTDESRAVVNKLNMDFVNTIRSTGGNNPKRHLMIPGYAASSDIKCLQAIELPANDNKIIVSVHAYLPYDFALNTSGTDQWSAENSGDTSPIDTLMTNLTNLFISQGTPVVIGEFGAMNKFNDDARAAWAKYYLTAAKNAGIVCCWWDNCAFVGSGENFGLMQREGIPKWKFPDLINAMTQAVNS